MWSWIVLNVSHKACSSCTASQSMCWCFHTCISCPLSFFSNLQLHCWIKITFFFNFFFFSFLKVRISQDLKCYFNTVFFLGCRQKLRGEINFVEDLLKRQHKTNPFINSVVMCLWWINEACLWVLFSNGQDVAFTLPKTLLVCLQVT